MNEINCPLEFLNVMPCYITAYRRKHYWIDQIDMEYHQFYDLSEERLISWLIDKKLMFDCIMKYAESQVSIVRFVGYLTLNGLTAIRVIFGFTLTDDFRNHLLQNKFLNGKSKFLMTQVLSK